LGRQYTFPGSDDDGGWECSARVRAEVLRPTVTGADGGGGMQWPELMVESACVVAGANGGGGSVHACGWRTHLCQFRIDLISADVGRRDAKITIYLKMCCSNRHANISRLIDTVLHNSDGSTQPVAIVRAP
jgi:hypothetical protein